MFKKLFATDLTGTIGTLPYFKAKLLQTNATWNVKGTFQSHMNFMLLIGEKMLSEQALQFFTPDDLQDRHEENVNKFDTMCNNF